MSDFMERLADELQGAGQRLAERPGPDPAGEPPNGAPDASRALPAGIPRAEPGSPESDGDPWSAPGHDPASSAFEPGPGPSSPVPLGPHSVVKYAVVEGAERYRRLMRVVALENRHFGLRMSPETVGERAREAFALDLDPAALAAGLDQLHQWGALDREYDTSLARTAQELRRNRYTYDITAAGKRTELLFEELDQLSETVGALEGSRLPLILLALRRIAELLGQHEPDGGALRAELERLLGDVERLHAGASDFMSRLNRVIATSEQIEEHEFEACKGVLIEHLQGFRTELRRHVGEIEDALRLIDQLGAARLAAVIVAEEEIPALPGFTVEQLAAQRHAELLEQWAGVRTWFVGSERQGSPWAALGAKVVDAIRAVLDIAERIIDRRTKRADRARASEHLARLIHDAPEGDATGLVVAALGIFHPRHVSVPELDSEGLAAPAQTAWADAPAAPIPVHLRRPGARTPGAGRGAPIAGNAELRERLAERRRREREELSAMLQRFAGRGAVHLSDLGGLSAMEFRHLLHWIGRAFEIPADPAGVRRADSQDGRARIRLRPPPAGRERTVLVVPQGRFSTRDFLLEVTAK